MSAAETLFYETSSEHRCRCGRLVLDAEIECEKCHADRIEARNQRYVTADEFAADQAGVSPYGEI